MMDAKTTPTRVATERERQHMRNIGRWKQESHDEALREHLSRTITERLVTSVAWTRANTGLATWRLRKDDLPELFYQRAKALGLYRPR